MLVAALVFCVRCHFRADYKHYQHIEKFQYGQWRQYKIFRGKFADKNKMCLPCQVMQATCRKIDKSLVKKEKVKLQQYKKNSFGVFDKIE